MGGERLAFIGDSASYIPSQPLSPVAKIRFSFAMNGDGPAGADLSVKLQRVVKHLHVEGFFLAVEFEVVWYPP